MGDASGEMNNGRRREATDERGRRRHEVDGVLVETGKICFGKEIRRIRQENEPE